MNGWHSTIHIQDIAMEFEDNLRVRYEVSENLQLDAKVTITGESSIVTTISRGAYLSLQDLALRCASSENFFNALDRDPEYLEGWKGSSCRAPLLTHHPVARYFDYNISHTSIAPKLHQIWSLTGMNIPESTRLPWIGLFIKKLPMDNERLLLAQFILQVGISWIALHEEEHFRQGHLQYRLKLRNENKSHLFTEQMSKAFEFQADAKAAKGVADIFFNANSQNTLPTYAQKDWCWLLRLLIVSVGLVIISIDIGRRKKGTSSFYPSPIIRIHTVIRHVIVHALQTSKASSLKYDELNYGKNDFSYPGFNKRLFYTIVGSLWDLTDILQIMENEEVLPNQDPLWPISDAFPFMTANVILQGSWVDNVPDKDGKIRRVAKSCSLDFGVTEEKALEFYHSALASILELEKLINLSNEKYLPLTSEYRKWQKS